MSWKPFLLFGTFAGFIFLSNAQANRPPTWVSSSLDPFPKGFSENTDVGAFLAQLSCTDPDNDPVSYYLRSGNAVRVFVNGTVTLAVKLDFESRDRLGYDLTFTCVDVNRNTGGFISNPVEARTQISVDDANDNAPEFQVNNVEGYSFQVSENATVGTVVESGISTVDKDRTANAVLRTMYLICDSTNATELATLTDSSKAFCTKFNLTYRQEREGVYQASIIVKAPLDYEDRKVYTTTLVAIVKKIVKDPCFMSDKNAHAAFTYFHSDNKNDGPGLAVSFTATINVQITIIDFQDTDPFFINPGESTTISEAAPVGSTIIGFSITAQDGDTGDRRPINLQLLTDPKGAFNLTTAVMVRDGIYESKLVVKNPLDRETTLGAYTFVVKATEIDKNTSRLTTATATATYSVFVTDINDNAPTFSQYIYFINVTEMENSNQNSSVQITGLHIVCYDLDEPQNANYNITIASQTLSSGRTFNAYSISPAGPYVANVSIFLTVDNLSYLDYDIPEYRIQTLVLVAREINTAENHSGTTTISIFLQDINDNSPRFQYSSYETSIQEDTNIHTAILNISATDNDSGVNGQIRYSLENGAPLEFIIDNVTGVVSLNKSVNYEKISEYVFLVYATDQGAVKRSSEVQVTIKILNINDIAPVFRQSVYQTSVNESSLQFLNPVTVIAVDEEDNSNITYLIVSGQSPNYAFVLNPVTGQLTLQAYLDYEQTPNKSGVFVLEVEASDNGNPPLTNRAQIRVTIIDQNNHEPEIAQPIHRVSLPEITPPGTSVVQITARDSDGGDNGKITYRIGAGASDNFVVDPVTGIVAVGVSSSFDYDVQGSYTLVILATDGGAPQKTASATVYITILDSNNKKPVFDQNFYTASVSEKVPVTTIVLNPKATDKDSTAKLQYSIVESGIRATNPAGGSLISTQPYNYKEAFGVNDSGNIFVKNILKKEYVQEISFILLVRDVNNETIDQTATTQVTITITGEVETTITFETTVNQVFMNEDKQVNFEVMKVTARDPNNRPVSNYMKIGGSPQFTVQPSGAILLNTPIDYENDAVPSHAHTVIVRAVSDDAKESATTTVTISVVDVNDNAPQFQQSLYVAQISETAMYPAEVLSIFATDPDSKSYGPLDFTIAGGLDSSDFEIFLEAIPQTLQTSRRAQVIVAQNVKLDYNRRSVYDLDLIVGDNADRVFSSIRNFNTAKLQIHVLDENNHSPNFKETNRSLSVPETAEVGRNIATIVATDGDSGLNGQIIYSLEPLNDGSSSQGMSLFRISQVQGVVTVTSSLIGYGDRVFFFQVRAQDRGTYPNSGTMRLQITVLSTEENDGTPKWLQPVSGYIVYAPEETPGYVLKDGNNNTRYFDVRPRTGNNITFSLSSVGPYANSFSINRVTGEITITGILDREVQERYDVLVYAEDTQNQTFLRSGRVLIVQLTDLNDNDATFSNPKNYQGCQVFNSPLVLQLRENTPENVTVATVRACDPDAAPYNDVVYRLYNGNPYCIGHNALSGLVLESDGRLVTRTVIDYEQNKEFIMCVEAVSVILAGTTTGRKKRDFDSSQVNLTLVNVVYVDVIIMDMNDNGPKFPEPTAIGIIPTEPGTGPVFALTAKDPDGRGRNITLYRIQSSYFYPAGKDTAVPVVGAFTIRADKGALYPAFPSYKQFAEGYFILTVLAYDSGNSSMSDKQDIKIYVFEDGQPMKVVLNIVPSIGFSRAPSLISELDSVTTRYRFSYLSTSEHRSDGDIDFTKTDVCFLAVDSSNGNILTIRQIIDLLDRGTFRDILSKDQYRIEERGQCYPTKSSQSSVKWRDLWWVLVAIAIFLFVCCVILIVLIFILYDRYKRYMETRKQYLVSQ